MTSRRPPIKVGNGDAERPGVIGGGDSRDGRNTVLNPVDLQVARSKPVRKILPAEVFALSDLANPLSNEGKPLSHTSRISDSDISAQVVSGAATEVRDSVGPMRRPLDDLTPEACEQWMLDVGYKRENGKLDHASAMKDAGVASTWAVIKMRWNKGGSPEDRQKIATTLLAKDRKQPSPTLLARRLIALEQWDALALDLLEDVEIFEKQIAETRKVAEVAKAKGEAQRALSKAAKLEAELSFSSAVPYAETTRRTRK